MADNLALNKSQQAPIQGGDSWNSTRVGHERFDTQPALDYLRLDELRQKEDELARARQRIAAKDMKNANLLKRNVDLERKLQQYRQMLSKMEREK